MDPRKRAFYRLPESPVQSVDGTIPLGRLDKSVIAQVHLHRRFAHSPAVLQLLDDRTEGLQLEELHPFAALLAQEQLKGGVSGLIYINGMLSFFDAAENAFGESPVVFLRQAQFTCPLIDGRSA